MDLLCHTTDFGFLAGLGDCENDKNDVEGILNEFPNICILSLLPYNSSRLNADALHMLPVVKHTLRNASALNNGDAVNEFIRANTYYF